MSRRHRRGDQCTNSKASCEKLLCVDFDVIFEVDAQIDEGSISVEAVEVDQDVFDNFA